MRAAGLREKTMQLEYQDGNVNVESRNPLLGRLELIGDDDDTHDLVLNRYFAEELISALTAFLMKGEGDDMPNISIGRPKSS